MPTNDNIESLAKKINCVSEKYQLIHATFAVEKLIEDKFRENLDTEIDSIREQLKSVADKDDQERLFQQVQYLKTNTGSRVRIIVEYHSQIDDNCARLTRSRNTFLIFLPKSLENIRKADGSIDFDRMKCLRKLMAHELGHIVLHTGALCPCESSVTEEEKETQADLFATMLISLRKARNEEIYADAHYREI